MREPMKALTLYPVWAMLIALEKKRLETRSWQTSFRGPLAITSSARITEDDRFCFGEEPYAAVLAEAGFHKVEDLPTGMVVCTALLTDIFATADVRDTISYEERCFGGYDDGRFAWKLEGVERINPPLPCKGNRLLWNIDLPALRLAAKQAREGALL